MDGELGLRLKMEVHFRYVLRFRWSYPWCYKSTRSPKEKNITKSCPAAAKSTRATLMVVMELLGAGGGMFGLELGQ